MTNPPSGAAGQPPTPPYRSDVFRGEIFWLDWSPGRGSEQTGVRPALIIQSNAGNTNPNYGLTIVATVSTKGNPNVPTHIEIQPTSENGLREVSYVKAEQIMTIAKDRLQARLGKLSDADLRRVENALKRAQGLR